MLEGDRVKANIFSTIDRKSAHTLRFFGLILFNDNYFFNFRSSTIKSDLEITFHEERNFFSRIK